MGIKDGTAGFEFQNRRLGRRKFVQGVGALGAFTLGATMAMSFTDESFVTAAHASVLAQAGTAPVGVARTFVGKFNGTVQTSLLTYSTNGDWHLGSWSGSQINWTKVGNTAGFGNLADGRPFYTGSFTTTARDEIVFYFPGNADWWLGQLQGTTLQWTRAGNTASFGNLVDGRPFFKGRFSGTGRQEIMFYYPGNSNWTLGRFTGTQLQWVTGGNTSGFGNLNDGRPFFTGAFTNTARDEIAFYFPGNSDWWIGQMLGSNTALQWTRAGNTASFGNLADKRPFFTGRFSGTGRQEILFYYPGNSNWTLGRFTGTQLSWSSGGNTAGFGNLADGRPFYTGAFTTAGRDELVFHYPGNSDWWLGRFDGTNGAWYRVANTASLGNLADKRPFYVGQFSGNGRDELLFNYTNTSNYALGKFTGASLAFTGATPTPAPTAGRGRYRVTINGFSVLQETWDHALEVDGKRDEIRLQAEVRVVNKDGATLFESRPTTRVMGDINLPQWSQPGGRVKAGTASALGGLRTGDHFPTITPWKRETNPLPDQPPFAVVKDVELVAGQTGLVVIPTVWEVDDTGGDMLTGWLKTLSEHAPAVVGAIVNITKGAPPAGQPNPGDFYKDNLAAGLPAFRHIVRDTIGEAGDRQIGFVQEGNNYVFKPKMLMLSYELAELLVKTDFGKGPGVLEINYKDETSMKGWYMLYLQVERIA